jgi:hypothetical protein
MLMPLDRDSLKKAFAAAHPFPFVKIENFLDPNEDRGCLPVL